MTLEDGVKRGVGPRLLVLMIRLLIERYFRALSHGQCCARCSRPLSLVLCPVVSTSICIAYDNNLSVHPKSLQRIEEQTRRFASEN